MKEFKITVADKEFNSEKYSVEKSYLYANMYLKYAGIFASFKKLSNMADKSKDYSEVSYIKSQINKLKKVFGSEYITKNSKVIEIEIAKGTKTKKVKYFVLSNDLINLVEKYSTVKKFYSLLSNYKFKNLMGSNAFVKELNVSNNFLELVSLTKNLIEINPEQNEVINRAIKLMKNNLIVLYYDKNNNGRAINGIKFNEELKWNFSIVKSTIKELKNEINLKQKQIQM